MTPRCWRCRHREPAPAMDGLAELPAIDSTAVIGLGVRALGALYTPLTAEGLRLALRIPDTSGGVLLVARVLRHLEARGLAVLVGDGLWGAVREERRRAAPVMRAQEVVLW